MARAAVVALALAGGCSSAAPVYGGPPPESEPAESDSTEDSSEEDTENEEVQEPEAEIDEGAPVPAYGGAPPLEE